MNKKQKKVLIRIIVAVALLIVLSFVPAEGWLQLALYMIPYLVIGYDKRAPLSKPINLNIHAEGSTLDTILAVVEPYVIE